MGFLNTTVRPCREAADEYEYENFDLLPEDEKAGEIVDAVHALATYWGDGDAFVCVVGYGQETVGDFGEAGEATKVGYVAQPTVRYCNGNAERCWLWPLSDFEHDIFPALDRVRDYWKDAR